MLKLLELQKATLTPVTRLANLALPSPGIKFKSSQMPFVQRENISHFLRACEMPPYNLPSHDRFLTVDLYDNKDPAQVIQCIGAFSRALNAIDPSQFPHVIGPKKSANATSAKGHAKMASLDSSGGYGRSRGFSGASQASDNFAARAMSPVLTGGSNSSKAADASSRQPAVSSWSKKGDEGATAPAWNIAQYGYMGGASQGNQGISFGARRQITSASVQVPSLAEKEKRRKEQEMEAERTRREQEDSRRQQEERDRLDEESRWEEESRRQRQKQKDELERQRKQWEEEERQWKEEEERRKREEERAASALPTTPGAARYLSQTEQKSSPRSPDTPENARIQDLERQLEEARERERQYQLEREQKKRPETKPKPVFSMLEQTRSPASQPSMRPAAVTAAQSPSVDPIHDERTFLQGEWAKQQPPPDAGPSTPITKSQPDFSSAVPPNTTPLALRPGSPVRAHSEIEREVTAAREQAPDRDPYASPAPVPQADEDAAPTPEAPETDPTGQIQSSSAANDDYRSYTPSTFTSSTTAPNTNSPRFSRFNPQSTSTRSISPFKRPTPFASTFSNTSTPPTNPTNPSNPSQPSSSSFSHETSMSSTAELAGEDKRRIESQKATIEGGKRGKTLMEREMERERERQREWEEVQAEKVRVGGPKGPRAMR